MEIGLNRLEIIRTALLVTRDLRTIVDTTSNELLGMLVGRCSATVRYIDGGELSSLLEDISCRIQTIKEMETL